MQTSSYVTREMAPALGSDLPLQARRAYERVPLASVPSDAWKALASRAVDPNAFFLPAWSRAASDHAKGGSGAEALLVWDSPARGRLIGMLPVVSAARALKAPMPVLVAWYAGAPLETPLLDRDAVDAAISGLLEAAAQSGAVAILFRSLASDGAAAQALRRAAAAFGMVARTITRHARAMLNANQPSDRAVAAALGAKKTKELRRQRNRLADAGDVTFSVASSPSEVGKALENFLQLEAQGWKGKRGTALAMDAGDAAFIRQAMSELAAEGHAEIATLSRGGAPVAAGIVLRHLRRAYFYKIAYDETAAKMSPGVQLCADITKHLCDDPRIDDADSTAVANHPMIDHIWRERIAIEDLLVPTQTGALPFNLCAATIALRHTAREAARRVYHAIRSR